MAFIANINHIPESNREKELRESLKTGGNIIITMGVPRAEVLVHYVVSLYDKVFGTSHDMDRERGMGEEEAFFFFYYFFFYCLRKANFIDIKKKKILDPVGS